MSKILPLLHLGSYDDELRPNLSLIQVKNGCATAVSPYTLVRINLLENSLLENGVIAAMDGKYIHKDVWEELTEAYNITVENNQIIASKSGGKAIYEFSEPDGDFFGFDEIFPKTLSIPTDEIAFNPNHIAKIQKVLKANTLIIHLYGSGKCALIYPDNMLKAFALVMPSYLNDEVEKYRTKWNGIEVDPEEFSF